MVRAFILFYSRRRQAAEERKEVGAERRAKKWAKTEKRCSSVIYCKMYEDEKKVACRKGMGEIKEWN